MGNSNTRVNIDPNRFHEVDIFIQKKRADNSSGFAYIHDIDHIEEKYLKAVSKKRGLKMMKVDHVECETGYFWKIW